jgi:hypothetical protein
MMHGARQYATNFYPLDSTHRTGLEFEMLRATVVHLRNLGTDCDLGVRTSINE